MPEPTDQVVSEPAPVAEPRAGLFRRILRWAVAILVLIVLYYAVGFWAYFRVDDDPAFLPPEPIEGGSRAVDMAAALIGRETVQHAWQPPDPFFWPNQFLIHPAAFQRGMQAALARFSIELEDQIGRIRGSSPVDPDLGRARGLINFPPDVWYFDLSKSILPTVTSARNYRGARDALLTYNRRVASKAAIFDVRTDSLGAALERIGLDLGAQSALVDQHLRTTGLWPINFDADRLFYQIKGRLYAYQLLLQELGKDFDPVIRPTNNVQNVWDQVIDTFREAGEMRPLVVIDGPPRATLFASHLAIQGFYLKRAVLQLKEMSQVLRN
jgi:hypothetical protein